jgi:hypothetical protein
MAVPAPDKKMIGATHSSLVASVPQITKHLGDNAGPQPEFSFGKNRPEYWHPSARTRKTRVRESGCLRAG